MLWQRSQGTSALILLSFLSVLGVGRRPERDWLSIGISSFLKRANHLQTLVLLRVESL